jgi:hypothetical protein
MGDEPSPWPDWSKPATKGDVIMAMVHTRACLVDIYSALVAARSGDNEGVLKQIRELSSHDDRLKEFIYKIGGKPND